MNTSSGRTGDPTELLRAALSGSAGGFAELRYHRKRQRVLGVEQGRLDTSQSTEHTGVAVRVLEQGTWGFASTPELEVAAVRAALDRARSAARASAAVRRTRIAALPATGLATGRFDGPGVDEALGRSIEELLELVMGLERSTAARSKSLVSSSCAYSEIFEEKGIVTSDGAAAWLRQVRPELRVLAVAGKDGQIQRGHRAIGVSGGWDCLFRSGPAEQLGEQAARLAVDLLTAGYPEGGRAKVLLSPELVGLLTHEAIGHTVEADFVMAGSVAAGKLGQRVASELVTLCDSGASEYAPGACGSLAVDDEGVPTQRTTVIRDGVLASYLHNRESAAHFEVEPTGNARAWEFTDEPLIRMRNTYIAPGATPFDELLAGMRDGYLLEGAANGQADSNGEFMFGTQAAYRVKDGKRGELLRGVNLSGQAFDVLSAVDGVGSEFQWDLGSGHCGKGQPAKVDAGGPWLRTEVLLGGRQ